MQIAIVPVGYADGLNRKLGHSKGKVLVNNKPCSILGEISMDSMMVDVSNAKATEGDDVIIFSPEQDVMNLSKRLGTISYEVMATLNRRIKRIYLKRIVGVRTISNTMPNSLFTHSVTQATKTNSFFIRLVYAIASYNGMVPFHVI